MHKTHTIDEYIQAQPQPLRDILVKIQQTLEQALPETEQAISYGIPVFKKDGKYIVYFAGWKDHVSLYPIPSDDSLAMELSPYVSGKGTLRFLLDQPVPYDLLRKVAVALQAGYQK